MLIHASHQFKDHLLHGIRKAGYSQADIRLSRHLAKNVSRNQHVPTRLEWAIKWTLLIKNHLARSDL